VRVLITPWASSLQWFPLAPAGWAWQNAGHEVRVTCSASLVDGLTGRTACGLCRVGCRFRAVGARAPRY
jgi:hypothetical protein